MIAFTGSKEVGLSILRGAGETPDGQPFVKQVVCEMGGKNAIIVDDSADLDEAVLGVRNSAFSYCGQKCSACSRAIVLDGVHDHFLQRLVESTRTLVIGDPALPGTDFGPVIDESAAAKIREYIEIGKREGRLELACEVPKGLAEKVGKPYVGPAYLLRHRAAAPLGERGSFWPGVGGHASRQLRGGPRCGQFDLLQADRRRVQPQAGPPGGRPTRFPRRQPLSQPRHHRSFGGPAAVRRLRPFRRRHQGRRRRLPLALRRSPQFAENTMRHGFAPGLEE